LLAIANNDLSGFLMEERATDTARLVNLLESTIESFRSYCMLDWEKVTLARKKALNSKPRQIIQ